MEKIGIYLRSATFDENAVLSQKGRIEKYIHCQNERTPGWGAIQAVYADNGVAGFGVCQPALRNLMNDLGLGKIDTVIATDFSRISRSLVDAAQVFGRLAENQGQLILIQECFEVETDTRKIQSVLRFLQIGANSALTV